MKVIALLVVTALMPICLFAQKKSGFELSGAIKGLKATTIYLTYTDDYGKYSLDSSTVSPSGLFTFNGKVAHPLKATLMSQSDQWKYDFYLENTDVKLKGDVQGLIDVTGSRHQESFDQYQLLQKNSEAFFKDLNQKYAVAQQRGDTAMMAEIVVQWNQQSIADVARLVDFIAANKDLYTVLAPLNSLLSKNAIAYEEGDRLFAMLSEKLKSGALGEQIAELLAKRKLTNVGQHFTDFTQPDVTGKPVSLLDFKGKYVLVHFWMSNSPSGRKMNKTLVDIYKAYREKGLEIVAVSFDEDRASWIKAIDEDQASWIQLSDLKGWTRNAVAIDFDISTLPQNFLIDKDGYIIAKNIYDETLTRCLSNIFLE